MNIPTISIVVPAYNCGAFLKEAIESMLNQTVGDFELIIINDGSTDSTKEVIQSFADERIVCLDNEKNMGLVFSLNKGIDHSRGKYIARMDGDDISLPDRFQNQLDFFAQHPGAKILSSTIELINENGKSIGYWEKEKKTVDHKKIRSTLPQDNCIAHPTIICVTELLKKYRYNGSQRNAEDYDLWLRLESDNIAIYKLDKILVKHRIVKNSFTRSRQKNVFWKNAKTKLRFTGQQLKKGKLNFFIAITFFYSLSDIIKGALKEIKKKIIKKTNHQK